MPYIKRENRDNLDGCIDKLLSVMSTFGHTSPGDCNYIITRILACNYDLVKAPSYTKVNEAIGVLECAKMELYRRVAAPYEDTKIQENGDVY